MLGLWLLLLACAPHPTARGPVKAEAEVRFRPSAAPPPEAMPLMEAHPAAAWDSGLATAAQEVAAMSGRETRIDPVLASAAAARAGYPGPARFMRYLTGGAFPAEASATVAALPGTLDVGLARRTWGDGLTLWIIAWAPRTLELDPLPRDLPLDHALSLRVDGAIPGGEARLYIAPPDGPVEELGLRSGIPRWVDRFHVPGEHRIEVVTPKAEGGEVALLFSVFVGGPPSAPKPMPPASRVVESPIAAEQQLYEALNRLRQEHGLPAVTRFAPFESLAREHSALMAAEDTLGHRIPGLTNGVAERAAAQFHPGARHHEDVAAAPSAAEALALIADSPGHLANLLCVPCTHASIGVALEPVLDRPPRLFVTVELLELYQGTPQPLEQWNRALPGARP